VNQNPGNTQLGCGGEKITTRLFKSLQIPVAVLNTAQCEVAATFGSRAEFTIRNDFQISIGCRPAL
jgi:hypothetical protein